MVGSDIIFNSLVAFGERIDHDVTNKFRFNDNVLQQATQITTYQSAELVKVELEWNDVPILFSAPKTEITFIKPEEKPINPNSSATPGSL